MSRVSPGTLAAWLIAAISAVYLILAGFIFDPLTFFSGDAGAKYLQAENLVHARWLSAAVRNPAPRIDPDGDFSVLTGAQFGRRSPAAPTYGVYSELFTIPISVCLALLGPRGLYVVPILATVATMILGYRLAARTS